MKIVYIPVTVPWNRRSMCAIILGLIVIIVMGFACLSTDWYHGSYKLLNVPAKEDLDEVKIEIGPWKLRMTMCGYNSLFDQRVCHDKFSVFQECRRPNGQSPDLARFSSHQETQWRSFDWCSGWKYVLAGLGLIVIACTIQFLNILISLVRERCHGPIAMTCTIVAIAGLVCIGEGVGKFMQNEIPKLENLLTNNGKDAITSKRHPGVGLIAAALAVVAWAIASILSCSLFCCAKREPEEAQARPPKIMIVSADRADLGKGGAPNAPSQPGFSAIPSHQVATDDVDYGGDQDIEMNQSHPSTANRDRYGDGI